MNITITQEVQRKVTLTATQCTDISINTILKALGLDDEAFIEDGIVKSWDDDGRFRPSRIVIREASQTDIAAFEIIQLLKNKKGA